MSKEIIIKGNIRDRDLVEKYQGLNVQLWIKIIIIPTTLSNGVRF